MTSGLPTHPLRLGPVTDPDETQRDLMTTGMERDGTPLNVFATMAHNPGVMRRVNALGGRFLRKGTLGDRVREIIILRSSYRSGSEYEFGQHTLIGRDIGLTDDEIRALATDAADAASWSARERRVIDAVDELAATDTVSDATWNGLRDDWSDSQLVELLLLPGFYRMLAGLLNAAGVQLEHDAPGWPDGVPDRVEAPA